MKEDKIGLKCMYSNVDQLLNKMEDLRLIIAVDQPDIILLTEIIPKAQKNPIHETLLDIEGYEKHLNFNFADTNLGASGKRGVAIYVKDGLVADEIKFQTPYDDHIWIEVNLRNNDKLLCGCIYRSPFKDTTRETTSKVCEIIQEAVLKNKERLLICGDFNYPEIDWENDYVNTEAITPFIETLQGCHLYQHVCNPTRYRDGQEPSLLDLILTNEEGIVHELVHTPGLADSDHEILVFTANCYQEIRINPSMPNYFKSDYVTMSNRLQKIKWPAKLRGGFRESYCTFLSEMDKVTDGCIAAKLNRRKKKNIYMSHDALRLKDRKERLWRKYKSTRTYYDRERYLKAKNTLRSLTRKLRLDFESEIANDIKSEPKKFWAYVKSKTKTRNKIPSLQKEDGSKASSASEKAEVLNNFFSSVFTDEDMESLPDDDVPFLGDFLNSFVITEEAVYKKLMDLKPGKSPGLDGWHPVFLKCLSKEIALPLSILFQKSLNEEVLPSDWLRACVTAIHKKGDKSLAGNYRPISITSILCKIMESLVRDELVNHMVKNNLISGKQHGFVPFGNCITNLLSCIEEWSKILESDDTVDVIYTDFAKAFDSVPHQRLLKKLKNNGIIGKTLGWIQAFLSDREQCVKIEQEYSDWIRVKSGIPQGSVLGPILFVLFINDMPDVVESLIELFADDAKIFDRVNLRDASSGERLQKDIDSLSKWSQKWQLPFNISKCKVLHIGNCNPCRRYKMNGEQLIHINEEKDLGVIVDSELKFHKQTAAAVKKANRSLGLIKKSFALLNRSTLPPLYTSLVRSHLEYANVIWGPFYKEDANLVEKVQRRATKVVSDLKNLTYEDRLRSLKLPSLQHRRRRGDMICAYNIVSGNVKLDANKIFKMAAKTLRGHKFKMQKKKMTKTTSLNVFSNRIIEDWNNLPVKIVTSSATNAFKNALDEHWKDEMYRMPS